MKYNLSFYLALPYPFTVTPDDGGYVVTFPDLDGCMTQCEDFSEIETMADDAKRLWLSCEYLLGHEIPLPAHYVDRSIQTRVDELGNTHVYRLDDKAKGVGVITKLSDGSHHVRLSYLVNEKDVENMAWTFYGEDSYDKAFQFVSLYVAQ